MRSRSGTQPKAALMGLALWAIPSIAHANVIWPALYVQTRLLSIPIIFAGLLIETGILRIYLGMNWVSAAKASFMANAASAILGLFLIPIGGIVWEFVPGMFLHRAFGMGTFNPATWIGTFAIAVLINTAIELFVLRKWFGLANTRRSFLYLLGANAVSVALAYLTMLSHPITQSPMFDPWPFD